MTLYRQLVVIIILIFVATFAGTFFITVDSSRHYLNAQLHSHAQDTATMLGLSISPFIDDPVTMETMVSAVFDRGDYQFIRITNINQEVLVKRSIPVEIEDVPGWFIRLIALRSPGGESLIMRGWKQAGSVYVESHPGYVYQEAWRNVTGTFSWFFICSLIILTVALSLLRKVLKPLYEVERQAESICRKEFVIQKEIPRTRELKRVVTAMNTLSLKVEEIFLEQAKQTEELREQLFSSEVTGLPNRRYFNLQLEHLVDTPDEFGSGALLLVALKNLQIINRELGFQMGDRILKKTAEILNNQIVPGNTLLAQVSGSEFSLLIPGIQERSADEVAEKICQSLSQLASLGVTTEHSSANVGIAIYRSGQSASELLGCADLALRQAQSHGAGSWHRISDDTYGIETIQQGARDWRRRLLDVIKYNRIELLFQPVISGEGTILHHEVLGRIPDQHGNFLSAGLFIPVAEREGLICEIDKLIVTKWIETMDIDKQDRGHFAINLSPKSIHNSEFVVWLSNKLKPYPELCSRLILEVSELGINRAESMHVLLKTLRVLNTRFAIDHFGRGFNTFSYLRSLKVEYLKIDGGFIRHICSNPDHQFYVQALIKTAHELDIPVIAACVESVEDRSKIVELGIDGMQGYLIGKPGEISEKI